MSASQTHIAKIADIMKSPKKEDFNQGVTLVASMITTPDEFRQLLELIVGQTLPTRLNFATFISIFSHLITKKTVGSHPFLTTVDDFSVRNEAAFWGWITYLSFTSQNIISLVGDTLDLSNSELTDLPNGLHILSHITGLDLSNNRFSVLPPVLSTFSHLTSINLCSNSLTQLPTKFIHPNQLESLDISHNRITSASWLTRMPNLVELYAQHNVLKTLPSNVHCPNLVCVNIRDNPISKIPSWLLHSNTSPLILSTENLARQWIDELPEDSRKALVSKSLGKPFSAVQGFAGITENTNEYSTNFNQYTRLWYIGHLMKWSPGLVSTITRLALKTDDLPDAIQYLTALTAIDLSANGLISLHPGVLQLTQITELGLQNNCLVSLPPNFHHLHQLQTLTLNTNPLTTLPASFSTFTNLTKLSLTATQLCTIPDLSASKDHLIELSLSDTQLTEIPVHLCKLTKLRELHACNLGLTCLPNAIGQLTHLTQLDLTNNSLSKLPNALGNLTQVKTLILSNNQLTSLPASFKHLTQLEFLFLEKNWIGFNEQTKINAMLPNCGIFFQ